MRVLHVIDAMGLGGGAEHSLAASLPLLRDRGVESTVVTLIPRDVGLQQRLPGEGFPVTVLGPTSWAGRVRALRRHVAATQPDLVHATLTNASLVARLALAGRRGGPPLLNSLVNTSYDPVRVEEMAIAPWKLRTLRAVDGATARHLVDHFHAITEAVADEAVDVLGVARDRITVIPRGRDATVLGPADAARRARVRTALGVDEATPLVVNVGRQDHQKAQALLVRAFGRVLDEVPDAVLLVAGRDGSATPEVHAAVSAAGVGDHVRLLGHRDDVLDLVAAADLFAFPSLYEGLGCSLIEAMGLSTPIVGSDAAAIAEVLGQGEHGVVVPRGDEGALAEAIVTLLGDPARRAALASRAAERFSARFELARVADATVELYAEVIARRR